MLVLPERASAPLHVADARDTVDDSLVVAVVGRRLQLGEQFRMILAQRFALEGVVVVDEDRRRGIVVGHVLVVHPHTRHAVGRRRHQVGIVEADVARTGCHLGVPVLRSSLVAQSQVPFSDGSRHVARPLEHVGNGRLFRTDHHPRIASSDMCVVAPPAVVTRQERVARRRTRCRHRMGIGEAQSATSQRVGVRCLYACHTVAAQVAISQVVGHDKNHIRSLRQGDAAFLFWCGQRRY